MFSPLCKNFYFFTCLSTHCIIQSHSYFIRLWTQKMFACIYKHTPIYIYVTVIIRICVNICVYMYEHTYMYACIYVYVCMFLCIYMYMSIYLLWVYTHMYVYMYKYVQDILEAQKSLIWEVEKNCYLWKKAFTEETNYIIIF